MAPFFSRSATAAPVVSSPLMVPLSDSRVAANIVITALKLAPEAAEPAPLALPIARRASDAFPGVYVNAAEDPASDGAFIVVNGLGAVSSTVLRAIEDKEIALAARSFTTALAALRSIDATYCECEGCAPIWRGYDPQPPPPLPQGTRDW